MENHAEEQLRLANLDQLITEGEANDLRLENERLRAETGKRKSMVKITSEEREHLKVGPEAIEKLLRERRALIYALLCLYKGGSRQGWESGLNLTESMDLAFDTLVNVGFDPCTAEAAAYVEWYPSKGRE